MSSPIPFRLPAMALFLPLLATASEEDLQPGTWPLARLQAEVPAHHFEPGDGPIRSLIYAGEPIGGRDTEVFAFYASPATLDPAAFADGTPDRTFPGIVLIHGGGGTSFSDWVWQWARRGYAAIAMDLAGKRPPAPRYDASGGKIPDSGHRPEERTRLEKGGLEQGHAQKFGCIGGSIDDDWPYHAVANVIKAHSLLRTFPGVDPGRTAVTGISWGGYTTCLVASHDDRFKAAVPVYGCGFLHEGDSVQRVEIDALGDRRAAWVAAYDPSSHLGRCRIPTFWINGTHDVHYPLDSHSRSAALTRAPRTFRIEPRMVHGHEAGWRPAEVGIYLDALFLGGTPLPEAGPMVVEGGRVIVPVKSATPLVKAELHYTADSGRRAGRKWEVLPATIEEGRIVAEGLPEGANTWIVTLVDERGALVSSEVGIR